MTSKQQAPFETVDPWGADGTPKVLVRIDGLRQVGDDHFELSGAKPRNIDWIGVRSALGYSGDDRSFDALSDRLADAVWDHDIREILAERIKRT